MIGEYNKSVILTYIGIAIALLGIWYSVEGNISVAMICLIVAGICDLFDGKIARMCARSERAKAFGVQIDSLADVMSFLILPVMIGCKVVSNTLVVMKLIYILYVLAGIIRLAWFNMTTHLEGDRSYYQGLPVTYMALILPTIYLLLQGLQWLAPLLFKNLSGHISSCVMLGIYIIVGVFFIWDIKVPKPKGKWYIVFLLLAIVETTLLIVV